MRGEYGQVKVRVRVRTGENEGRVRTGESEGESKDR